MCSFARPEYRSSAIQGGEGPTERTVVDRPGTNAATHALILGGGLLGQVWSQTQVVRATGR